MHVAGKSAEGASCRTNAECGTKYCDLGFIEGRCKQLGIPEVAQQRTTKNMHDDSKRTCVEHSECAGKVCIEPYGNMFGWASDVYCAQKNITFPEGAVCSMDEECKSGDCRNEYLSKKCAPSKNTHTGDTECFSERDCKSGRCLGWLGGNLWKLWFELSLVLIVV